MTWDHIVRTLLSFLTVLAFVSIVSTGYGQPIENRKYKQEDKFRQLSELLPTPNQARTGSGAPGTGYWQQQANYEIDVELDDDKQRIIGSETITYKNNSPDTLKYLWLQLDQNIFRPGSDAALTATARPFSGKLSYQAMERMLIRKTFDGGVKITAVKDAMTSKSLPYTVVKTMMRIDLPEPLVSGGVTKFSIDWNYNINNSKLLSARTGYEHFEEDKNNIYEIAHWYPRMVAYTDVTGWQHKQFLGRGEFTLEFGDYTVRITAPEDHIVGATGVLMNSKDILTDDQRKRLDEAKKAKKPVFVVTPEEAKANQAEKAEGKKTWIFKADNVRDFAFASSRKFIWDAQGHNVGGNQVMAMSYYPNEAEPLWSKYSTHSIIHTLNVYSRYTFDYPYPVAISVNGPVYGMEYPMICFNGPRPEKDGTYSKRTKYGLISVIIHEVGHNYFPMIVNHDERQWTWMDEGLNSFLQYLTEQEWEEDYPSRGGEPKDIVTYMSSSNQVPVMTNSEAILQFGPNAYSKPATALNILRESILGRKQFDYAFKEYAQRWKFKRPMPADFFRTMEDASGTDLDWFWRGWFYTTDHCDIAIESVQVIEKDSGDPRIDKGRSKEERDKQPQTLSQQRNKPIKKQVDIYPELKDFYNSYDPLDVSPEEIKAYENAFKKLTQKQKELLKEEKYFYVVNLKNVGGLVMPVILQLEYENGKKDEVRIPAEIWRRNNEKVAKMLITDKPVKSLVLDPHLETADVDLKNNYFPRRLIKSRFKLFKENRSSSNEMRRELDREKKRKAAEEKKKADEKKKAEEAKKAAAKKEAAAKTEDKKPAGKTKE